jgi:poly(hydroxyalkanoate) depolymerase family esterase
MAAIKGYSSVWANLFAKQARGALRIALREGSRSIGRALEPARAKHKPPIGDGDWLSGVAIGPAGARRYRLFRPKGVKFGERLPLMVMLHGCHQDAKAFAASTRMNVVASRERFLVLYPEQDRVSNPQNCWNWYETKSGRAHAEAALIMLAIDQVCVLYGADRDKVAVAGLSAGASMGALLVTRYPHRFKAAMMHSGIPPGTAHSTLSALVAMKGDRHSTLERGELNAAAGWPSLLVIHGAADAVVSVKNGQLAVQVWADAAGGRAGVAREVRRGKRYPMTITDFKKQAKTIASLVLVRNLGHAWSGGASGQPYSDHQGPDASRMVWQFAAKQFALTT